MRTRLMLSFVAVALVAIASMFFVVRLNAGQELRFFLRRGGMMGMNNLATELEGYYQAQGNWQGVGELLADYRGMGMMGGGQGQGHIMGAGTPRLRVADGQGNVLADNQETAAGGLTATERENAVVLQDARGATIGYLVAEGVTAVDPSTENALLNLLVRAGLIAAGIAAALALLLSGLLSIGLLRPVQALTGAAARMAGGDLGQRVAVQGGDEVAALGRAFNHMADSLQEAEQNRRAMTADIAHELRTPLAVQRAHLEALQDGVYPLTVENLQPVLESTELLTRLVDDLRTLALADAGELRLELAPTDLAGLVGRVVERFRPEAESRGVRLAAVDESGGEAKAVLLDAGRFEQILSNLLSNALRHTPEGGEVVVTLAVRAGYAEVQVADTGEGIPPEALPHLFERFYRADRSRSREKGGTGLGLAIARQLALAHGGDLAAMNRAGAVFVVKVPVLREEKK